MSFFGVIKGLFSTNSEAPIRIDASTHSLQVIKTEHHEIHDGNHYCIDDVVDLSSNNVVDIQFVTPDTTKWTHLTFNLEVESETEWYTYEDVDIINTGTTETPINNNRNSVNTSDNLVYIQNNSNLSNANVDTIVSGATELKHGIIGDGKKGGTIERQHELLLKQNTNYSIRFIANTAGYVNYELCWYEHTNRN